MATGNGVIKTFEKTQCDELYDKKYAEILQNCYDDEEWKLSATASGFISTQTFKNFL